MNVSIFTVLILVNYLTVKCDEDSTRNAAVNERTEETEMFTEDYILKEEQAADIEENPNVQKIEGYDDGLYELRIPSDFTLGEVSKFDEFSELTSTEVTVTEQVVEEETVTEKAENDSVDEVTRNSTEFLQGDNNKSSDIEYKQLELSDIPKAALEIEEKKLEDLLEASAERKLDVDYERPPSKFDKPDRKSDSITMEVKEVSDQLNVEEPIAKRRMFLSPSVALDGNTKSEDTSADKNPGFKSASNTAFDQFDFNNERKLENFILGHKGSNNNRLIIKPDTVTIKTDPINIPATNSELPYLSKIYLTPGFNIISPLLDAQLLQGQQHVPIYMELKFDEMLSRIHMVGIPNLQRSEEERQEFFKTKNEQDEIGEQKSLDRRQLGNLNIQNTDNFKTRNEQRISSDYIQFQNLRQNPIVKVEKLRNNLIMDFKKYSNNKQSENLKVRDPVQRLFNYRFDDINQEKIDFQPFYLNQELASKNIQHSKDDRRNMVSYFQGIMDSENSHERERFANPYSYNIQTSNAPNFENIVEATKNYDPNSPSFKTLFHKLEEASGQPLKLRQFTSPNSYSTKTLQSYPYILDSEDYSYDLSYFPNF